MMWPLLAVPLVLATFLYLVGVLRTWRCNRTDAVFLLLFLPWSLFVVVRYWNSKDSPRFLLLGALVLMGASAGIAYRGLLDPSVENATDDAFAVFEETSEEEDVEAALRRSIALAALVPRSGRIELAPAKAAIELPSHFRFIDRQGLMALEGPDAPSDNTLGWLVHDSVDLTAAGAWHVMVQWIDDGYIVADEAMLVDAPALLQRARRVLHQFAASASRRQPVLAGYAEAPVLDTARDSVSWVEQYQSAGATASLECYAVRLGRRGALMFSASAIASSRQELCLRSVRLLAGRVVYARGESHDDHGMLDLQADYDLTGLISGENLLQ